jgi:hypothetical protein
MSTSSESAWADYHAAAGSWEAWVDAKLSEQREHLLAVMAEMLAGIQRDLERTVLEIRAASRPMDGRDGRSLNVRGTWDPGASYFTLDLVARDGAMFVARKDNPGECPGDGWQLSSRQGRKGERGERGERGESGAPGKDAPVLQKWLVDRRARTATPIYTNGLFGPVLDLTELLENTP